MAEILALSFTAAPKTFQLRAASFHVHRQALKRPRKWRFMLDLTRTCELGAEETAHDLVGFETPEPTTYLNVMQLAAEQIRLAIREADEEESAYFNDGRRYAGWTRIEWKLWIVD